MRVVVMTHGRDCARKGDRDTSTAVEVSSGMDFFREQLRELLDGGHAHIRFDEAVKDFPASLRGVRPQGSPHSAWELLEHLRIAQWDILEFSRNAKHVSPKWPEGYWPESPEPPNAN